MRQGESRVVHSFVCTVYFGIPPSTQFGAFGVSFIFIRSFSRARRQAPALGSLEGNTLSLMRISLVTLHSFVVVAMCLDGLEGAVASLLLLV